MISLQTTEGSGVKFVFTNSDHYLYGNGTIEVPLNSLALVTDKSDMFTFKKAATNDPFISAKYSDIGMTKEELETFYNENMVGGNSVDPEEVQALIDASISGNVKSVSSYSIHSTSGDSIGLLVRNVDGSSAYTNVFTTRNGSKLRCTGNLDELHLEESFVSGIVTSAIYDSSGKTIELKNESGVTVSTIDATDFIKDGMLDSASVEDVVISGETVRCLVLTFNTESGKEPINIPLSDLSLPIDSALSTTSENPVQNKVITTELNKKGETLQWDMTSSPMKTAELRLKVGNTSVSSAKLNLGDNLQYGYPTSSALNVIGLTQESAFTAFSASTEAALSGKQDTLIAGSGISISGNVISADGGSITIDPSLDSGSTNAVANSAITEAINAKAQKTAAFGSYAFGVSSEQPYIKFKSVASSDIINVREIYYPRINNKETLTTNQTWAVNNLNFSLVETSAITSSITSASTDTEIPSAKAVYDAIGDGGGGLDEDFLQANANALYELKQEGKATNERFDNYYTKAASDGRYASNASIKKAYYDKAYVDDKLLAISASLNELNDDKQETLVAGDGISISGNVISAEGGGAEYSAGTNIEITTANTINCTIPISGNNDSVFNTSNVYSKNEFLGNNAQDIVFGWYNKTEGARYDYTSKSIILGKNNYIYKATGNTAIGSNNTIGNSGGERSENNYVFGTNNSIIPFIGNTTVTNNNYIIGHHNNVNSGSSNTILGVYSTLNGSNFNTIIGYCDYAINNKLYNSSYSNIIGRGNTISGGTDNLVVGKFNSYTDESSLSFGDSGATLMNVGNGLDASTRHNALELRQNGDLYYVDTYDTTTQNYYEKPMLKLQDVIKNLTDRIAALEAQLNNN